MKINSQLSAAETEEIQKSFVSIEESRTEN